MRRRRGRDYLGSLKYTATIGSISILTVLLFTNPLGFLMVAGLVALGIIAILLWD
jgi:hypothetical protein